MTSRATTSLNTINEDGNGAETFEQGSTDVSEGNTGAIMRRVRECFVGSAGACCLVYANKASALSEFSNFSWLPLKLFNALQKIDAVLAQVPAPWLNMSLYARCRRAF